MAIIHISGMDATGKSTICNLLSNEFNCDIQHFDKPKDLEDGKKQYFEFLQNIDINKDIICDRYHDGEHIYAPLYRGYESNYLKEFESELRKYPYLFINTTADLKVIFERISKRGEDFVKEEHYQTVLDLFERYIEKQSMPYIKINTSNSQLNDYIEKIKKYVEIIKEFYNFCVKNNCKNIYYGNMEADNFIIVENNEIDIVKEQLIRDCNYDNYWITTNENMEFVDFQIELLQPKKVIVYGGEE